MTLAFLPMIALTLSTGVALTSGQGAIFPTSGQDGLAQTMASPDALRNIAQGLPRAPVVPKSRRLLTPQERAARRSIFTESNQIRSELENALRNVSDKASRMGEAQRRSTAFGPFMNVNRKAQRISKTGAIFTSLLERQGGSDVNIRTIEAMACPFRETINCVATTKFRTADGSCNNLYNPMWGKSNTPFDRFIPPHYGDGMNSPRNESIFRTPLPLPRVISTGVHKKSTVANLHPDISHMTMEFGQFVSHDINSNTLSTGVNGSALTCCNPDGSIDTDPDKKMLGCLPIVLPPNDPFFSQYNRSCMNFVRAAPTPDIHCDRGYREQLNQVTHFLDVSTIYGSDEESMNELRTMSNGLLKVTSSPNGDLLMQNPAATGTPACRTTGSQHCFKTGEGRANQQPALMTLHTLFMREHNRVARKLHELSPSWDDERLFQEARKVVGAEVQHITYNEYLPTIMGTSFVNAFGFNAQPAGSYYTGYDSSFKPGVRNGFAAAAYRFAHGTVRDHFAPGHLFKDHFLTPEVMYQNDKGPSFVVRNLIQENQQGSENLLTTQVTNHMFENAPGTGLDLASTNINRGRDHGLPSYNQWRAWCGLPTINSFTTGPGGSPQHTQAMLDLLQNVYSHPSDIDLWTGIVTEIPLEGRAVGPTGACLIGRQFWVLKNSDRFYYENDDPATKFEMNQLDEIRKTSLARIICDNTNLTSVPADVFETASSKNPTVQCSTLPEVDLSHWVSCDGRGWSDWSAYTRCFGGYRRRSRTCQMACAENCVGNSFELNPCSSQFNYPSWFRT
ncbi:chorion peroxidase-like [Liolophura sinensis]|uniref:chorion peroxidase-like n=1 Tax=Liolophura sinensis TaxID=3198878 RepID=UPI003158BAA0